MLLLPGPDGPPAIGTRGGARMRAWHRDEAMGRRSVVRVVALVSLFFVCLVPAATGIAASARAADGSVPDPAAAPIRLPKITALVSGHQHDCFLDADGGIWCWGFNLYGQLGDGTTESRDRPVRVQGIPGRVVEIAAMWNGTCAITDSRDLWCWGENHYGQLGNGTTVDGLVPSRVLLDGPVAMFTSSGRDTACAALRDGSAWCWGENTFDQITNSNQTQLTRPTRIAVTTESLVAVAPGASHTCALTAGGGVRCWGYGLGGQLGTPELSMVTTDRAVTPSGLASGVRAITAGYDATCVLLADGSVRCWGATGAFGGGQPGPVPAVLPGLPGRVDTIALSPMAAGDHGCATVNGRAWCWGVNDSGQLGDGTTTDRPAAVEIPTAGIALLGVGGDHGTALLRDGSLVTWGDGDPTVRPPFAAVAVADGTYRETGPLVPTITTLIPTPADISTDPPVIEANLILAALAMIAFTIATEVLNRTLGDLAPPLRRRFGSGSRFGLGRARLGTIMTGPLGRLTRGRTAVGARMLAIAAFYGVVFALLDPTWDPLSVTGLWLVLIMAVSFGLVGLSDDIASFLTARRWGVAGDFVIRPGSLMMAAGSTLVSRALVLVPGVMIGTPEALEIDGTNLDPRRAGRLAGIGLGAIFAIGAAAWVGTLGTSALRANGSELDVAVGGLEALLLLVFAVAVQNVFVQLLAFGDSSGRRLLRSHRVIWAIALLGVSFLFWHTLVNPRGDLASALQRTNVQAFIATVGIILSLAVVTWVVTRIARYRAERAAAGLVPTSGPVTTLPIPGPAPVEVGPAAAEPASPALASAEPTSPAFASVANASAATTVDVPGRPAAALVPEGITAPGTGLAFSLRVPGRHRLAGSVGLGILRDRIEFDAGWIRLPVEKLYRRVYLASSVLIVVLAIPALVAIAQPGFRFYRVPWLLPAMVAGGVAWFLGMLLLQFWRDHQRRRVRTTCPLGAVVRADTVVNRDLALTATILGFLVGGLLYVAIAGRKVVRLRAPLDPERSTVVELRLVAHDRDEAADIARSVNDAQARVGPPWQGLA